MKNQIKFNFNQHLLNIVQPSVWCFKHKISALWHFRLWFPLLRLQTNRSGTSATGCIATKLCSSPNRPLLASLTGCGSRFLETSTIALFGDPKRTYNHVNRNLQPDNQSKSGFFLIRGNQGHRTSVGLVATSAADWNHLVLTEFTAAPSPLESQDTK